MTKSLGILSKLSYNDNISYSRGTNRHTNTLLYCGSGVLVTKIHYQIAVFLQPFHFYHGIFDEFIQDVTEHVCIYF